MKQKKTVLVILLVFALLLGAAYLLYTRLSSSMTPNQLSVQGEQPQAQDSADDTSDTDSEEPQPVPAPDFTV